ncbi:MAG: HlyD family efflux transporter periplasmic adaptor subunit [Phycisphaerales bacterium]|nr:HlyD family efflux transporter periplasmic adaptor subunit [Phycisphaerales bacterium]
MRRTSLAILMLFLGAAGGAAMMWLGLGRPMGPIGASAHDEPGDEHEGEEVATSAISVNGAGEVVVRLDTDVRGSAGLETETLRAATKKPVVSAFGVLQEDPGSAFTIRAPVAGMLRAGDGMDWPKLHTAVAAGASVGIVVPRLTPMEQIDLKARLAQARAEADEAEAALASAQSSYEHKRALNTETRAVSDRVLEEARAAVQTQEARLTAARRIVGVVEAAERGDGVDGALFELASPLPGEIVEVLAQPGEAVEPGQPLLRIASFDTLIAQVELPIGESFDPDASSADIELVGPETRVLPGERIGLGAAMNVAARGATLLYRLTNPSGLLRPGAPVIARVPAIGGERAGVLIPRSAVIRLFGRAWAYVATEDNAFTRRELVDGEPEADSWFATHGFEPDSRVVTTGAQVLLSEELKAQIEREEAASE